MKFSVLTCLILISPFAIAADLTQSITISRKDFLEFKTNSYVAGFKKYDTSILITETEIRLSAYINSSQSKKDAEKLLKRIKTHLESMLKQYDWSNDMTVQTSIYCENSTATNR